MIVCNFDTFDNLCSFHNFYTFCMSKKQNRNTCSSNSCNLLTTNLYQKPTFEKVTYVKSAFPAHHIPMDLLILRRPHRLQCFGYLVCFIRKYIFRIMNGHQWMEIMLPDKQFQPILQRKKDQPKILLKVATRKIQDEVVHQAIYPQLEVLRPQSYEIKSPPRTILWFRIIGIFSVENIDMLGAMML